MQWTQMVTGEGTRCFQVRPEDTRRFGERVLARIVPSGSHVGGTVSFLLRPVDPPSEIERPRRRCGPIIIDNIDRTAVPDERIDSVGPDTSRGSCLRHILLHPASRVGRIVTGVGSAEARWTEGPPASTTATRPSAAGASYSSLPTLEEEALV